LFCVVVGALLLVCGVFGGGRKQVRRLGAQPLLPPPTLSHSLTTGSS
jgi:hypothetical protein